MSYTDKVIRYFSKPGPQNTEATLEIAKERAKELGIKDVVVASTYGDTAFKAIEVFKDMGVNLVVVTISMGFEDEGWIMKPEVREELTRMGAKVLTCTHALGDDVDDAFAGKYGGISHKRVVADTLRRFCQGMKVCVEITLMAADAGLIDVNRDVIAIAGTDRGADTAVVIRPSYTRKFLSLRIKEIIAKPL